MSQQVADNSNLYRTGACRKYGEGNRVAMCEQEGSGRRENNS